MESPYNNESTIGQTYTQINFNKLEFTIHGNMQGSKEPKTTLFNFNIIFKNQSLQSSWNFVF